MGKRSFQSAAGADCGPAAPTLLQLLRLFVRSPYETLIRRWNWKSELLSSAVRATLFFSVNLTAGFHAALAAGFTEMVYRAATAGFFGALTQNFSRVQPAWQATLGACIMLPLTTHTCELLVHWLRGTEKLWWSIFASISFTALSTAFHVFVMRRGLLTVGEGSQPLWKDLLLMPKQVALFAAAPFIKLYHACRGSAWTQDSSEA